MPQASRRNAPPAPPHKGPLVSRQLAVLLCGVLVLLCLARLGTLGQMAEPPAQASSSLASSAAEQGGSGATSAPQSEEVQSEAQSDGQQGQWQGTNTAGPVPQQAETMQLVAPTYEMIALPENGRVDMKYFDTVTFVGDSITQGLQVYTNQGIPNAHYCAYKSIGLKAVYDGSAWPNANGDYEVPMEALVASQPQNVYVLLGANAMVNTEDSQIVVYYREMLQKIRESLPAGTGIYLQSITPVTPGAKFEMERINGLNQQLAQIAYQEDVHFVDLAAALQGEDGYLRTEYAGADGIHLSVEGYAAWKEYLVTHTAYNPATPYLLGSPYYTAA
ncbi:MAG: GDSL-type esterase/lipase family protein [Oscillospiraceae bacterium]